MKTKRIVAVVLALTLVWSLMATGCSSKPRMGKLKQDTWSYYAKTDVFYQTQLVYCKNPTDTDIQSLAVFVPGEYFNAVRAGDIYKCDINELAVSGKYTYKNAPIIFDINSVGYNNGITATDYVNQAKVYTQRGYIYVTAGFRGAEYGAPYGVADLKAAIKYLRYIDEDCPGDAEKIIVTGTGVAGGLAAVLGAGGDSPLYEKYLDKIGALNKYSDAVYGVMCWSPITGYDVADAAYEWNMGISRGKLTHEEKRISAALSDSYADYLNALKLTDGKTALTIDGDGGTYTDYLKSTIEESLTYFLNNVRFPYTAVAVTDNVTEGNPDSEAKDTGNGAVLPEDNFDTTDEEQDGESQDDTAIKNDGIVRTVSTSKLVISGKYDTVQDYVDALNTNKKWVTYDPKTKKATITGIDDFVQQLKGVTRGIAPFDQLDRKQGENMLFGIDGEPAHFDAILTDIMKDNQDYSEDFAKDMQKQDKIGSDTATRVNMYNPMYYIHPYYEGNGTAKTAKLWRIRSGIFRRDTSMCTEVNLALALQQADCRVDFMETWGVGSEKMEPDNHAELNALDWLDNLE